MENQRCILTILAHPDDESFGMGGTLALYAQQGVQVRLLCATRGEVGEVDSKLLTGYKTIGDLRENELRCAAEILGLTSVDFLGYRDSGMRGSVENKNPQSLFLAPLDDVARKITGYIRKYQPQIVLTFDPAGGYLHPDHVAVHNATVKAFSMASDPMIKIKGYPPFTPTKLYFHTMSIGLFKYAVKLLPLLGFNPHQFGKNKDIDLTEIVGKTFPVNAKINYRSVVELHDRAAACHVSQGGGRQSNLLFKLTGKVISPADTFMRAYPAPSGHHIEKNLFEGIS
jgi:N-acetyl-1-D-myo-inositol-2-amino-2-deoxy-alpha-D-glucopyranoside deacetylase